MARVTKRLYQQERSSVYAADGSAFAFSITTLTPFLKATKRGPL